MFSVQCPVALFQLAVLLIQKLVTTQDMSRDSRTRWTTTDNEGNSEFVHRSRRRSRQPTRTT